MLTTSTFFSLQLSRINLFWHCCCSRNGPTPLPPRLIHLLLGVFSVNFLHQTQFEALKYRSGTFASLFASARVQVYNYWNILKSLRKWSLFFLVTCRANIRIELKDSCRISPIFSSILSATWQTPRQVSRSCLRPSRHTSLYFNDGFINNGLPSSVSYWDSLQLQD